MDSFKTSLGIYFTSQESATVVVAHDLSGNDAKFAELLLFMSYTLRTLNNLGQAELVQAFAAGLRQTTSEQVRALSSAVTVGGVQLASAPAPPSRAEKSFDASLSF